MEQITICLLMLSEVKSEAGRLHWVTHRLHFVRSTDGLTNGMNLVLGGSWCCLRSSPVQRPQAQCLTMICIKYKNMKLCSQIKKLKEDWFLFLIHTIVRKFTFTLRLANYVRRLFKLQSSKWSNKWDPKTDLVTAKCLTKYPNI